MSDRVTEAVEMLGRAERFVYDVESEIIDPQTGIPDFAHAPAIATARADLMNEIEALRAALGELAHHPNCASHGLFGWPENGASFCDCPKRAAAGPREDADA